MVWASIPILIETLQNHLRFSFLGHGVISGIKVVKEYLGVPVLIIPFFRNMKLYTENFHFAHGHSGGCLFNGS